MTISGLVQTYENLQNLRLVISNLRTSTAGRENLSENEFETMFGKYYPIFQEYYKEKFGVSQSGADKTARLNAALATFQEKLNSIEILELEIAFEHNPSFIQKLVNWVVTNVSDNTVIKVSTNKSLVAGVLLTFRGKYADCSAKKKLEKFFESNSNMSLNASKKELHEQHI